MVRWDKIEAVSGMQRYLKEHAADEPFCWSDFYAAAGFSSRHANRIFKELTQKTPAEYLRDIRLSQSCASVLQDDKAILDIALDAHFDSHEGYTRAFVSRFGRTPSSYRRGEGPVPLFVSDPIKNYYVHLYQKESCPMDQKPIVCTVTPIERPQRKLMLQRSVKATDYWSYCEEKCCDWVGMLNSLPGRLDIAAILELPPQLVRLGTSPVAAGVELPMEYGGDVPGGYEVITLPPCTMLYFQTGPFENEEDFGAQIGAVSQAMQAYQPERFGYAYAPELAPRFNFGADAANGAKQAVPVRKL